MIPVASAFTVTWEHFEDRNRQFVFLVLVGFVLAFNFIRLSTRLQRSERVSWWPGTIETGSGLHVHHLVFGIVLMLAAGMFAFANPDAIQPWQAVWAFMFGVGAGLTIDEFALWLRLEDVYWSQEGRTSIDAALFALAAGALLLLASAPEQIETTGTRLQLLYSVLLTFVHIAWALLAISKGRLVNALIGIVVPFVSPYAAVRLAKPGSWWARRFYGARNPEKQRRAEARFPPDRRTDLLKDWLRDLLGGLPSDAGRPRITFRQAVSRTPPPGYLAGLEHLTESSKQPAATGSGRSDAD